MSCSLARFLASLRRLLKWALPTWFPHLQRWPARWRRRIWRQLLKSCSSKQSHHLRVSPPAGWGSYLLRLGSGSAPLGLPLIRQFSLSRAACCRQSLRILRTFCANQGLQAQIVGGQWSFGERKLFTLASPPVLQPVVEPPLLRPPPRHHPHLILRFRLRDCYSWPRAA